MYSLKKNKTALTANDDKRIKMLDSVTTYLYGHRR